MAKVKIETYGDTTYCIYKCPCQKQVLWIPITGPKAWKFSGSPDLPSLQPSLLTTWKGRDEQGQIIEHICHSFLKDGKVIFLNDCNHNLAGQTVELPDID